jgi:hypothetical protein
MITDQVRHTPWLDTSRTRMLNEAFLKTGDEICTRLLKQVESNTG